MKDYKFFITQDKIVQLNDGRKVSGVSRVLPTKNRAWEHVIFMQGRPILDSELNLVQQIGLNRFDEFSDTLVETGYVSGFIPQNNSNTTRATISAGQFLFEGKLMQIDDGNGSFTVNMGNKPTVPRHDLIFMCIYHEEVGAPGSNNELREQVKQFGNLLGVNLPSDIIDPALPSDLPTTHRVQLSYRMVSKVGADFALIPAVNTDGNPVSEYRFARKTDTEGVWVAGDGSLRAAGLLGTVDGYVYAIQVAEVTRNPNDTSIQASNIKMLLKRAHMKLPSAKIYARDVYIDPLILNLKDPLKNNAPVDNVQRALELIWAKLDDHEARILYLEECCRQMQNPGTWHWGTGTTSKFEFGDATLEIAPSS